MSNLTELLPAGGSGKTVDFVASGTLPNGKPVILKADGTVEVVGESSTAVAESIPAGSAVAFSGNTHYPSVSFDPNTAGKFIIAYSDSGNSWYGTAIVGTVSGTSITFGSEQVFSSAATYYTSIAFDPNTVDTLVITYQSGSVGKAVVGTVSGTSITFGSDYVFNAGNTEHISVSFDPNTAGKFVVVYRDTGNLFVSSDYGTAIAGTISVSTITFGAEYVFKSANASESKVAFDPNTAGRFVVVFTDNGNSGYATAIVGTVSGTTLTFGSDYVFNSGAYSEHLSISFDPNTPGKFVVSYMDGGNSNYGTAIVGTVSGTSISYGAEYVFSSFTTYYTSIAFDPNTTNKFVVVYRDAATYYGDAVVGTVSGTVITFGSKSTFNNGSSAYSVMSFDPNTAGKFVVVDNNITPEGRAILGQIAATAIVTNLTTDNFLGTSTEAYADTDTATILLQGGISTNQSGLTIGSDYYVQEDGTLATTADTISVKLGKALSATSILLSGE